VRKNHAEVVFSKKNLKEKKKFAAKVVLFSPVGKGNRPKSK
jgi:hypothetical protein